MLPRAVTDLLSSQLGIVTRPALLAAGYSHGEISGWVRSGHLEPVLFEGVPLIGTYRVRGGADSSRQRAAAAVARCRPRAALTGPVVLGALEVEGFCWDDEVVVRVPVTRRVSPMPFAVLRDHCFDEQQAQVGGIAGSTATRALMDTGLGPSDKALVTAIDSARWRKLTTNARLRRCATQLVAHGHEGARHVLALLESGTLEQESHGERALAPVVGELRPPVRWQVWLSADIRADCLLADAPLVIEYLGRKDHAPVGKRAKDEARNAAIRELGWQVLEVWHEDLAAPDLLLARILGAREILRSHPLPPTRS